MRVVVVDENRADRDLVARYVAASGHEVEVAGDAKAAAAAVERGTLDALLIEASLMGKTGTELIRRVRMIENGRHVWVIAISSRPGNSDVLAAVSAGADDLIRKPFAREEVAFRLESPNRIRTWHSATGASAPHRASIDLTSDHRLHELAAWKNAEQIIGKDMQDMLGVSLRHHAEEKPLRTALLCAEIPLAIPAARLEVRLAMGLDARSAHAVAMGCLGDADAPESVLRDTLREFGNMSAGAFKRSAAVDGVALTVGLPVDADALTWRDDAAVSKKQFVLKAVDDSLAIAVEIELRRRAPTRVTAAQLREGMVLIADLHNAAGALLITGGTRLTASAIERVSKFLGARAMIEVADAA